MSTLRQDYERELARVHQALSDTPPNALKIKDLLAEYTNLFNRYDNVQSFLGRPNGPSVLRTLAASNNKKEKLALENILVFLKTQSKLALESLDVLAPLISFIKYVDSLTLVPTDYSPTAFPGGFKIEVSVGKDCLIIPGNSVSVVTAIGKISELLSENPCSIESYLDHEARLLADKLSSNLERAVGISRLQMSLNTLRSNVVHSKFFNAIDSFVYRNASKAFLEALIAAYTKHDALFTGLFSKKSDWVADTFQYLDDIDQLTVQVVWGTVPVCFKVGYRKDNKPCILSTDLSGHEMLKVMKGLES